MNRVMKRMTTTAGLTAWLLTIGACVDGRADELLIGRASVDITPDRPVPLWGQMHTRISQAVESPIVSNAVAIESRKDGKPVDQAILVSCDLVAIPEELLQAVRDRLQGQVEGFDVKKLVISGTHTHTGPVLEDDKYQLPTEGIMRPSEYLVFCAERTAEAAAKAWRDRKPGGVSWGLGHAVVAQNRRAVYADGRAVMYGATNQPDFRGMEGPEDHDVDVLFFWGPDQKLIATAINLACTAQEVEGRSTVNADFWHPVREQLRARYGPDLVVLGLIGAAGDQSPHVQIRKAAEERMQALRKLDRLGELARRIVAGWDEAHDGARQEIHYDAPFVHTVRSIELPVRVPTDAERAAAEAKVAENAKNPANQRIMLWHQEVVDRHERQKAGAPAPYVMELHVLRIGDVAIATNAFELFTEYGLRIKARSRALQTFVVQLAGPGSYLPTAEAVRGGGYSAIVESGIVGPEGGAALVDQTVEAINALWPQP